MSLEQSAKGLELISTLRRSVQEKILADSITTDQLAERLGLLPVGVQVLFAREEWTLDVAVRVAEAVGLEVKVKTVSTRG